MGPDSRDQLFAKSITVRTLNPLADPGKVFTGLEAVDSWRQEGTTGSWPVAAIDPKRSLVFRSKNMPIGTYAFVLQPVDAVTTRLIVRDLSRFDVGRRKMRDPAPDEAHGGRSSRTL